MTPSAELERTCVAAADWLPGYEILAVVGTGGFGTVFKARQLKLDRVVAVKVIQLDKMANPAQAARFEAEAVTLGKFHHPNIVQVYDYALHNGRMFIAMELLEGDDLGRRIVAAGKLDERTAWAVARQAASALAHAAALGVVHRDVKPPNLFLVPTPTGIGLPRDLPMVKVTDFGLARTKWAVDAVEARLTDPGTVLGTPAYMAPEQYRGSADVDHRVDIYALGATVFHALAGRPPFGGANVWDVMVQKLVDAPPSWPDVSRASIELIADMMASDVNDRIGTYEELIERIDRLPVAGEPAAGTARAPRPSRPPAVPADSPAGRWRWWPSAVTAPLFAIAGVGVGVALTGWRSADAAGSGLTAPPPQRLDAPARYVSAGQQAALFDGESLAGWLPPAAGGVWTVAADDEGTAILSGTGFTRRSFARFDDYRATIGLDATAARAAEVHFALPAQAPDAGRRLVLRVSKSEGATFGTRDGDRGAFQPLGRPVPFPPPEWFEGRRPYLEVRFARAGNAWTAWFNGTEAGRAADDGQPKAAEVRLFAEGGHAHVDTVVLEKLTLKPG